MNKIFNQNTKLIDIKDEVTLYDFLCYKAANHTHFKMYSEEDIIDSIIEEGALFIGDGQNWNDVNDKKNLQSDNQKIFAKCFSFSKSESVAMWMLYGGIKHKGAMIDLRKEDINNLLSAPEISLGKWVDKDNNDKIKEFQVIKTLKRSDNNFTIELIDDNTDERVFMGIGDSYSFVSDAGTYNNRFRLRLTDITGIKYSEHPADDIKVVVEGDEIRLYGTDKGEQLSIYTVNGMFVDKINTSDCVTVYTTTLRGVIIIKLGVDVFKVFKL